jgi:hypothetical protein
VGLNRQITIRDGAAVAWYGKDISSIEILKTTLPFILLYVVRGIAVGVKWRDLIRLANCGPHSLIRICVLLCSRPTEG